VNITVNMLRESLCVCGRTWLVMWMK